MAIPATEKLRLKKLIKDLKSQKALHTEFVSVYIPAGYEITKITQHLAEEQGTASNIKSAATRKNVQGALEKMIQHLRTFPRTPPNGLAVFSGNVAASEGKQNMQVWSIEPPVPLNTRIYRCDKHFVIDIVEEMLIEHEVYGLVVLDRRDATLALLKGKTIVPLQSTHSEVPGKTKAGGQCCMPDTLVMIDEKTTISISEFQVGNRILTYDFKKNRLRNAKILDKWEKEKKEIYEIITKNCKIKCSKDHLFFVKKGKEKKEIPAEKLNVNDVLFYVNKDLERNETKIVDIKFKKEKTKMIDISVSNQNFIANGLIVHNSAARYARIREGAYKDHFKKISEFMKNQFMPLGKNLKGIIIGGPGITIQDFLNKDYLTGDIKKKIIGTKDLSYTGEDGLHELLNRSEDLLAEEEVAQEKQIMNQFLGTLRDSPKKASYGEKETLKALEMNAVDTLLISEIIPEDRIFELEEMAQQGGAIVRIISVETREGVQLKDLGGIAAILRFEIE